MYIDTFVPKSEKKKMNYSQIFFNYVKGHKDFNTLKLYALKSLLSKNQFYLFFSSSDMHQSYHLLGYHGTGIKFSFIFFKFFAFLKFNMLDKKAVLIRLKIKTICLTKKLILNSYKITVFLLINSGNEELIHHINCFE